MEDNKQNAKFDETESGRGRREWKIPDIIHLSYRYMFNYSK